MTRWGALLLLTYLALGLSPVASRKTTYLAVGLTALVLGVVVAKTGAPG